MPDPLEQFLLEYVDAVGGLVDEVEPQVYDVLLPDAETPLRLAFDPDALPEHPSAQLLTFGSAVLDELLVRAQARGQVGLAFLDDMHLSPHGLAQRITRDLILPDKVTLRIETIRPFYITHSLFWFETTYSGDEKEQALYLVAVDRYYGREVRYLDAQLVGDRLGETRRWPFADAPSLPLDRAYLTAREAVVRTVGAETHTRQQQAEARLVEQTERLKRYYAESHAELAERIEKTQGRGDGAESLELRQEALNREEALRLDDIGRKAQIRVQLRLVSLLHIKIPRLFIQTRLSAKPYPTADRAVLTLTWDPLVEKTDALDCPRCHHPTFELRLEPPGGLHCPNCTLRKK